MAPKVKWLPKKPGALSQTASDNKLTTSQPSPSKPSEKLSHKTKCPSKVSSNVMPVLPKSKSTIKQTNQKPPLKASTAKKPKCPKPVPYLTFKKNPYLGVGKVNDEDKLPKVSLVTKVRAEIELPSADERLKRKSIKMVGFKPPLKKKCNLQSCEQCSMVKCGVCSACLNPHWKKRCKIKSKCPRLYPSVLPNLSEANGVHDAVSAESNQLHDEGVLSALSDQSKTVSVKSTDRDVLSPQSNPGVIHGGGPSTISDGVNIVGNMTGPKLSQDNGSAQSNLAWHTNIAATTVSKVIYEPVSSPSEVPGVEQSNLCEQYVSVNISEETTEVSENVSNEKSVSVSPEHQITNKVKWKCANCSKLFSQFKSFNKHKCDNMKTKTPCASCNKLISHKFMPIHIKMHSKLKLNCPKCSRSFVSQEKLNKHMSIHEVRIHSCSICGKVFKTNSLMVKHMNQTHDEKSGNSSEVISQIKCRFCEIELENLANLRKHMTQSHEDIAPFICSKCPKVYFSSRGLRKHMQEHKGEHYVSYENPSIESDNHNIAAIENNSIAESQNHSIAESQNPSNSNNNSVIFQDGDQSYVVEVQENISQEEIRLVTLNIEDY